VLIQEACHFSWKFDFLKVQVDAFHGLYLLFLEASPSIVYVPLSTIRFPLSMTIFQQEEVDMIISTWQLLFQQVLFCIFLLLLQG